MTVATIKLPPDEAEFIAKRVADDAHDDTMTALEVYDDPDALLEVYDRITWHAGMIRRLRDGRPIPVDVVARLAREAKESGEESATYELGCPERTRAGDPGARVPGMGRDEVERMHEREIADWREQVRLAQSLLDRVGAERVRGMKRMLTKAERDLLYDGVDYELFLLGDPLPDEGHREHVVREATYLPIIVTVLDDIGWEKGDGRDKYVLTAPSEKLLLLLTTIAERTRERIAGTAPDELKGEPELLELVQGFAGEGAVA